VRVARNLPERLAIAAAILSLGWWLSTAVRHLVAYVDTNPARLGFEMLGIEIGLAAFAIAIACALPGSIAHRLGLGRSRVSLGAVIALTIGTLGLSHAVEAMIALWSAPALEHSVATGISRGLDAARGRDFAIAFVGTVLGPAIGEELFCRGLVQRGLARWIGPAAAIAIAAVVFGWLHQELVHGTIAALIGAYLGVAAYWSDSTRPAIAGHAANNFMALLGSAGFIGALLPPVPSLFAGIAVAALGLSWAYRARPARPRGEPAPAEPALQPGGGPTDA
jgi:membrane protease YdiL (CAAX protease family)